MEEANLPPVFGETSRRSPPPSPGVGPLRLSDCIKELLHFTLSSAAGGDDIDVGISSDYCAQLLRDEPFPLSSDSHLSTTGISEGVPTHPLYKHLAHVLEKCICSGTIQRVPETIAEIPQSKTLDLKEIEWTNLIVDKGSEMVKILNTVDFELHVQEPYLCQLRVGLKKVEGRCAIGDYKRLDHTIFLRISPGSLLLFNKCLLLEVQHVNWYSSFSEMLQMETLAKVLPGIETIEKGVEVYRKFYTEEKEKLNGVLAISVSKPASQPYVLMAAILKGLNYDGLGYLIGVARTYGTITDALPPTRSTLLSSAAKPYQPNVKGVTLTAAARALAKHVNRTSKGWWGDISGDDSNKNRLASEVINRLLSFCCWMNIHAIEPYGCVFEI